MSLINKKSVAAVFICGVIGLFVLYVYGRSMWVPAYQSVVGRQTVSSVVQNYGPAARARLEPYFAAAGIAYPPSAITLLAIKDSAKLELWAGDSAQQLFIREYPIRALSGKAGPKLNEGDRQVPEGIYRIEGLNPNSSYHLSMKLNYPNAFDVQQADKEGRTQPGTNIFIHGKAVSIGCLAMGDSIIEELFVLAADSSKEAIDVVIAPTDPRPKSLLAPTNPKWVAELYTSIEQAFAKFPR